MFKPKPENKMSDKRIHELYNGQAPFVEMKEGETMPRYILVINFWDEYNKIEYNFMGVVLEHIKEKRFEGKGRMRFPSGIKKAMEIRKSFIGGVEDRISEVKKLAEYIKKYPRWKKISDPVELYFTGREKGDEMQQKMDDSGLFDMGTITKH